MEGIPGDVETPPSVYLLQRQCRAGARLERLDPRGQIRQIGLACMAGDVEGIAGLAGDVEEIAGDTEGIAGALEGKGTCSRRRASSRRRAAVVEPATVRVLATASHRIGAGHSRPQSKDRPQPATASSRRRASQPSSSQPQPAAGRLPKEKERHESEDLHALVNQESESV